MTYSDGTIYVGHWKGDKRHGYGEMKYAHGGTTYKGEFRSGLKEGQGLYTWVDGAWYNGTFKKDRENGFGTYHFSNGDEYVGHFLNGRLHGNGTYTWASGGKSIKLTRHVTSLLENSVQFLRH